MSERPSLLTRPFRRVVLATHACFLAFGLTLPILPRFVVDELGGGEVAVGTVFAVHALAAVLVRPLLGSIGDRVGRRPLVVAGGLVTAVALAGHLLVLATGGFAFVWLGSALLGLAVVAVGVRVSGDAPVGVPARTPLLHPRARVPGAVFAVGSLGFIGFLAFMPLHAEAVGIAAVAPVFLVCSGTIVAVRLLSARLPDQLGPRRVAAAALVAVAAGLAAIAAWPAPGGLYLGAVLLAVGTALFAPAMTLATVRGTPAGERARVVATFTLFLDLASGVAPIALGLVAAGTALPVSFALAAGAVVLALALVLRTVSPGPADLVPGAVPEVGA